MQSRNILEKLLVSSQDLIAATSSTGNSTIENESKPFNEAPYYYLFTRIGLPAALLFSLCMVTYILRQTNESSEPRPAAYNPRQFGRRNQNGLEDEEKGVALTQYVTPQYKGPTN